MAIVGGFLVAAAVAGTWFVISRRPAPPVPAAPPPTALPLPTPTAAPAPATSGMTEAQFQTEVARRLAEETKKIEDEARRQREAAEAAHQAALAATAAAIAAFTPTPVPTEVVVAAPEPTRPPPPTPTPAPAREVPPEILRVVKPEYPQMALHARIRGLVILRVLVSETGQPLEVEVVRGASAGLTEAAVAAVKKWTFTPAKKADVPVRAWTTVPIPFEP